MRLALQTIQTEAQILYPFLDRRKILCQGLRIARLAAMHDKLGTQGAGESCLRCRQTGPWLRDERDPYLVLTSPSNSIDGAFKTLSTRGRSSSNALKPPSKSI